MSTPWDLTLTFLLCIAFGLFAGVLIGMGLPRQQRRKS